MGTKRVLAITTLVLVLSLVLLQWIIVYQPFIGPYQYINLFLGYCLLIVYLSALQQSTRFWYLKLVPIILSLVAIGYVAVFADDLVERAGLPTTADLVIGAILVIVVLEGVRQRFGPVLPIIALVFIGYAFFSPYLPPPFYHHPIAPGKIITWLSIGFYGVYGRIFYIGASIVFYFMIFGVLVQTCGAGAFFTEVGKMIGRNVRSGPAALAVTGSSLMGSITGSAAANVVVTGSVTIPAMKKVGFSPDVAGAIECVSSNGGTIMPPVMAGIAFIMSDFAGITYLHVCGLALIPAILYYVSVFFSVQCYALKNHIAPWTERVDYKLMLRRMPLFIIPIAVILGILVQGFSPTIAAFWAVPALVGLSLIDKETRPGVGKLVDGLAEGTKLAAEIALTCALIGIFISVMDLTGLDLILARSVQLWSGGHLIIALLIAMAVAVILGAGTSSVATYIILAFTLTPIFINMDIDVKIAHLLALFWAQLGHITPPVAVSAIPAAALSGGTYLKTAWQATKFGIPSFVIPLMFVYQTAIAGQFSETPLIMGIAAIVIAALTLVTINILIYSCYLTRLTSIERALAAGSLVGFVGFIFFQSNIWAFAGGLICFALLTLFQWHRGSMSREKRGTTINDSS